MLFARTKLWQCIDQYIKARSNDDPVAVVLAHREVEERCRELESNAVAEWTKLKERYGWSFETADEAIVTIEGNKRSRGKCFHCDEESYLCDGVVVDGHWYCCQECSEPYTQH